MYFWYIEQLADRNDAKIRAKSIHEREEMQLLRDSICWKEFSLALFTVANGMFFIIDLLSNNLLLFFL